MKQSIQTDIAVINRILKYIKVMGEAFEQFNIKNSTDLEESHICQLAITQAITNIYELNKKLQTETSVKLILLSKLQYSLKAARNISSHDYYSLDFEIIYRLVCQLLKPELSLELREVSHELRNNN